jgi:hypothetical protein
MSSTRGRHIGFLVDGKTIEEKYDLEGNIGSIRNSTKFVNLGRFIKPCSYVTESKN